MSVIIVSFSFYEHKSMEIHQIGHEVNYYVKIDLWFNKVFLKGIDVFHVPVLPRLIESDREVILDIKD